MQVDAPLITAERTKTIHLPVCLQLPKFEIKRMRRELEVLPNGLPICKIRIINPFNQKETIDCVALIDTGSESSLLCSSLFNKFTLNQTEISKQAIDTLRGISERRVIHPFNVQIPFDHWGFVSSHLIEHEIPREEYQAIIGTDILRHFILVYHGLTHQCWLEM
jgi:hypothetical protein